MSEELNKVNRGGRESASAIAERSGFVLFSDIDSFAKAVVSASGLTFDFTSVIELNTDFMQGSHDYLLLNIKEYGDGPLNYLLFLTGDKAYSFSSKPLPLEEVEDFQEVLDKPFGRGTVLCFLALSKVIDDHKQQVEALTAQTKKLSEEFAHDEYGRLSLEFERFDDRLEEFHGLLLGLQQRRYRQVETQYISFDYSILIAESLSLQGRCRRRLSALKDLRHDHEMQATEELNQRIVRLNDVVKRLTAITVILMLPTLIASHFGMNFAYMPELRLWWAYPAVVVAQLIIMGVSAIVFRKIGWL